MKEGNYSRKIIETLKKIINKIDEKSALAFSAGLDSSILAKILKILNKDFILYSVVTNYSKDLEYIEKSKNIFNNIKIIKIDEEYIKNVAANVMKIIPRKTRMDLSIGICFYAIAENAIKDRCKIFITAQGADELFGGYYKYLRANPKDLERILEEDFKKCLTIDYIRDKSVVEVFGLKYFAPFSTEEMYRVAREIPIEYKIKNGIRKYILRIVAKEIGLPEFIYNREKKALQYSTGIEKIVKRLKII